MRTPTQTSRRVAECAPLGPPHDAGGVVAVKGAAGCVQEERAGAATGLGGGDGGGGRCGEGDGGFPSCFASDVEDDVSSGGTEILDTGGAGFADA